MQKITLLVILSVFVIFNCFSQNVETYFESQKTVSYQKLYIHTDREFYFENDTLWFTAYLVDGQSHSITSAACNLYIDVINVKGDIVQSELYIIQNGTASGNIILYYKNIPEGKYLVRAYTDYLKNFGDDSFFTKNIAVSSIKNSFEIAEKKGKSAVPTEFSSKLPAPQDKIDISFLPEGGFLLADESNCVAFKAVNQSGEGIDVSGKLFDDQGKQVLSFQALYKGAGKFFFYPKSGEKYHAKIDGWPDMKFQLPEIKGSGAKIKLISQENNKLQILVHGKNTDQNFPYYLACMHRGEGLFFMEVNQKNLNAVLKIDPLQLGSGINRFVLLDGNMNPLSERLVFQNNVEINTLDVEVGDDSYATREEIQLNIMPSQNSENESALVSISVVDENYINASGSSENIASYLLLNSDLKGTIESPAGYFISNENLNAQTRIDLLMCTNGWSNYKWNLLLPGDVKFDFKPQLGFDFKGEVKRSIGKKGLDEGNVFFMVKSQQSTQFIDLPLNDDGTFALKEVVFYDSAAVFAQGRNKREKNTIQFDMKFPDFSPPEVDKNLINAINSNSQLPVSVYRQRYLSEMKLREFYPDRYSVLIDEVDVKGKNYLETWKTGPVRKGDGPYLLTPKQIAGSPDIINFLQYKVVGVWPARGRQSITLMPGSGTIDAPEPVFWIDYHLMLTVDDIRNYSIDIFETIEIMNPPMSYFYRAQNGVILLTTKTGRTLNKTKASLLGGAVKTMKGFTRTREFYSPKYSPQNLNSKVPDFRNTLYWNPGIILKGENEVYFNACDNVSRYKVIVEGITETGKICIGEAEFEVDSFSQANR